ncbi:dihydroorotase family protein [Candidatus Acetothermia bacterium]|jgi:dihydroorotase|nr:dihydroorotase family protein [Candidatus Acetothermia bacterium]MCI2431560.1 dihydroorotase family protein [Candidatus Acetothermia bacterium]MCI2437165.1 dihydroorotase family protein [Candidatus Acetothermia bacterium]
MTVLQNTTIFADGRLSKADIAFDEKIRAIGASLSGDEKLDGSGKLVLPGAIDVHVHARDLNQSYKEDWRSLGRAAVAGGVTTAFAMPNTDPPLDTVEIVREYRRRASAAPVNAFIYGGITRENIAQLVSLANEVDGFKLYLGETTGNLVIRNKSLHRSIFKTVAQTKRVLAVHAQRDGAPAIVTQHESDDIGYVLDLADAYGTKLHLVHVTTRRGTEKILEAKHSKLDVTFEICPHYLFFTDRDRKERGAWLKINPPLATEEDREFLWWALRENLIDIVATDHAPHTVAEKSLSYERAPAGVPGVEYMPVLLLDAVNNKKLSLDQLVAVCSVNPARRFGLAKGELSIGLDADLVVVDMNVEKRITREMVRSKCGWSPYEGMRLRGWPVMVFVGGRLVHGAEIGTDDRASR